MSFNEIMSKYSNGPKQIKYVEVKKNTNQSHFFTRDLNKSNYDSINSPDYNSILKKGCVYIPNFLCNKSDTTLFENLMKDIELNAVIPRNKHYLIENPDFSNTFNEIVEKISKHFNLKVLQTRLNYYKDGNDFKTFHHDSHAYSDGIKEDFTAGISLGDSRQLAFKCVTTEKKFYFDQHNGDLFAFDHTVNQKFKHGVPKSKSKSPRISIIVWGKLNQN